MQNNIFIQGNKKTAEKSVRFYAVLTLIIIPFVLIFLASCSDGTTENLSTDTESKIFENESDTEIMSTEVESDPYESFFESTDGESEKEDIVHVTSIELDRYSIELEVGKKEMPIVTMLPENALDKSEIWSSSDPQTATVDQYGNITGISEGYCTVTVRSADNMSLYKNVDVTVIKRSVSVKDPGTNSEPTYINGILVVNKTYPLPAGYEPGVDPEAYAALMEMFSAASGDGISLWVASGYRSYATQNWLYNNYVAMDGKAAADTYSARPGHSEHQTGLAFDLNQVDDSFAYTLAGKWIAENSWKYGYTVRYPKDKESLTGYKYEPWHVRYFGKDVSKALFESGLCLEEYLGITSEYDY